MIPFKIHIQQKDSVGLSEIGNSLCVPMLSIFQGMVHKSICIHLGCSVKMEISELDLMN